jgi:predicted nucleic acid-binding Zn ribbon protein
MPTYKYRFDDDGTEVEVTQSIYDEVYRELRHPESLDLLPVKRVPQVAGATFKGDGWARKS